MRKTVVLSRARSLNKKESGPGDTTTPHPTPYRGRGVGGSPQADSNVDEIKAKIKNLDAAERRELLAALALDLNAPKQADRDLDMWVVAAHEALAAVAGGRDGAVQAPAVCKRVLGGSAFQPVLDFMEASRLSKLEVTKRQAVYRTLAELVVRRARKIGSRSGAPLSAKLVANVAGNIGGIFESAFPGYVASGLAHLVATRPTAGG